MQRARQKAEHLDITTTPEVEHNEVQSSQPLDKDGSSESSSKVLEEERDTNMLLSDMELDDVVKNFSSRSTVEGAVVTRRHPQTILSYKIRKLFLHGSFLVVGVCILVAGGVASRYHPYVDPEEYYNCSGLDNTSYHFSNISA